MRGTSLLQGRFKWHGGKQVRAAHCPSQAICPNKLDIPGDQAMDTSGSTLVRLGQQGIEHGLGTVNQIRPVQVFGSR